MPLRRHERAYHCTVETNELLNRNQVSVNIYRKVWSTSVPQSVDTELQLEIRALL